MSSRDTSDDPKGEVVYPDIWHPDGVDPIPIPESVPLGTTGMRLLTDEDAFVYLDTPAQMLPPIEHDFLLLRCMRPDCDGTCYFECYRE